MQTTTEQDIWACFRLLLGREPHTEERSGHLINVGRPLGSVVSSYLQSLEFRNRGMIQPAAEVERIDLDGYVIYVAPEDPLIASGIRRGGYEPEVTEIFLRHMKQGAVIDIGANCGYFSFLARSKGLEVYAFEPLQRNVRLLYASLAANSFNRVHVIAAAASDWPATLAIGASYTNGIVNDAAPTTLQAALSAEYVAAVRVDDVIPPDIPISLIKIDVEGHEYRAISGARQTIERSHPVIISEFAPAALLANSGRTPKEYLGLLRRMNYEISMIGSPEITTDEAILAKTEGIDHIDILALGRK